MILASSASGSGDSPGTGSGLQNPSQNRWKIDPEREKTPSETDVKNENEFGHHFSRFRPPKRRPKSRKMPSKFDVIFDLRFGRRFFTFGVDFSSILGWILEAKAGPGRVSRARGWICQNHCFIAIKQWFFKFRQSQERGKIHLKSERRADSDLNTHCFHCFPVLCRFWEPKWVKKKKQCKIC